MPPSVSGPLDRFPVRLPRPHTAQQATAPCSSSEPAPPQQPSSAAGESQPQCSTCGYGIDGAPGDCSFLSQQLAAAMGLQRQHAQPLPHKLRHSQLLGRRPFSTAQCLVQEAKTQQLRALCGCGSGSSRNAFVRFLGMNSTGEWCMALTTCAARSSASESYVTFSAGWPNVHAVCNSDGWQVEPVLAEDARASEDGTARMQHSRDHMPCMPPACVPDDSMHPLALSSTAVVARWSPTNDDEFAWCGARGHQAVCAVTKQDGAAFRLDLGPDQTSSKAHDVQWVPTTTCQLSCSSSKAAHLYDLRRSRKPHASITPAGGGSIGSLQYSPDGTLLIGATSLGQVQMWDVRKTGGGCRQLGATGVYQYALLNAFDLMQARLMGDAMSGHFRWQHLPISLVELLLDPCDPGRLAVVVEKRVAVIDLTRGRVTHAATVDHSVAVKALGQSSCERSPASLAEDGPYDTACRSCWDATGSVLYTRGDTVVQRGNEQPLVVPALAAVDLSASSGCESPYRCSSGDGGRSAVFSVLEARGNDVAKFVRMRDRHTSFLPLPQYMTAVCRDEATDGMLVGLGGSGGVVYVS